MKNTSDNIENIELLEIIVRLEEKIIDVENELTIQKDTLQKIIKTINKLTYSTIQLETTIQELGKIEDVEIVVKEKSYMQDISNDENKFTTEELIQKVLQVKAGSALLIHSAVVHGSVKTKKQRFARFVMTDRFCPLIKLPYLRNEKAPLLIPYMFEGEDIVDYNSIKD